MRLRQIRIGARVRAGADQGADERGAGAWRRFIPLERCVAAVCTVIGIAPSTAIPRPNSAVAVSGIVRPGGTAGTHTLENKMGGRTSYGEVVW